MEPKPRNVLLACDGSEPSRRALDRFRPFVPHASVTLVAVAAPVYRDARLAEFAEEDEQQRQQPNLAEAQAAPDDCGIERTTMLNDALCDVLVVK
jgi:hypothetical protein